MGRAKVAAFYDDPVKHACDTRAAMKAFELRSFSVETTVRWMAMRWAKFFFHWGKGTLRRMLARPNGVHDDAEDEAPRLAQGTSVRK